MAVKEWTSIFPTGIDSDTQMPTLINGTDASSVTQIHSVRDAIIELETIIGSDNEESGSVRQEITTLQDGYNFVISKLNTSSGDISGSLLNPTVAKIQGNIVSDANPSDGYVLAWNNSASTWSPQIQDAYRIQNRKVSSTSPTDGYALIWNSSGSNWAPNLPVTISDTNGVPFSFGNIRNGYSLVKSGSSIVGLPSLLSGYNGARPEASSNYSGCLYYATDSLQYYYCDGSTWKVASNLFGNPLSTLGVSPGSYGSVYCSASVNVGPQGSDGTSGVLVLWLEGAPTTGETIADFRDSAGNARGWYITIGQNAGDRYLLGLYLMTGGAAYRLTEPTNLTLSGLTGRMCAIAWSNTGGAIRASLNGGSVVATNLGGSGSPVARLAGDPIAFLTNIAGTTAASHVRFCSIYTFSSVILDADLVTLSGSSYLTGHVTNPIGSTPSFGFNSAWWSGLYKNIWGETFRLGMSTSYPVLPQRWY